jgi:glycosyltransferase involved in cell wall biosynthesis
MVEGVKVEIVVPVYNEEKVLEKQVKKLIDYLGGHEGYSWSIIVADNGSTDRTRDIAHRISVEKSVVRVREIKSKGRGFALRDSWLASSADVVCYMDVDLSTDLNNLHDLIDDVIKGKADLAYGSRLSKDSHTKRSAYREILSRGYNFLVKMILGVSFQDAQCGFKALSIKAVRELIPDVRDNKWFFDTELLYLAEKRGYRLNEVPVAWTEDRESKVDIAKTIIDYVIDLIKLRMRGYSSAQRG